jgi:chemotaxis protein CheD
MHEPDSVLTEVYVQPGESHLARKPVVFRTLLGSCVGVTFLVPRLGIGALCHPMLPLCPPSSQTLTLEARRRYVDFAILALARQLDKLRAYREEVEIKLFGGADVLPVGRNPTRPTVGRLNAECATRVLREEGLHVVASRLGGCTGVHLLFDTRTGEVLVRRLA